MIVLKYRLKYIYRFLKLIIVLYNMFYKGNIIYCKFYYYVLYIYVYLVVFIIRLCLYVLVCFLV